MMDLYWRIKDVDGKVRCVSWWFASSVVYIPLKPFGVQTFRCPMITHATGLEF